LPPDLMQRVLPQDRTYIDNNMNIDFIRRSPDGKRVLFGGKTGTKSTVAVMARRLTGELRTILPDLRDTPFGYSLSAGGPFTLRYMPGVPGAGMTEGRAQA